MLVANEPNLNHIGKNPLYKANGPSYLTVLDKQSITPLYSLSFFINLDFITSAGQEHTAAINPENPPQIKCKYVDSLKLNFVFNVFLL